MRMSTSELVAAANTLDELQKAVAAVALSLDEHAQQAALPLGLNNVRFVNALADVKVTSSQLTAVSVYARSLIDHVIERKARCVECDRVFDLLDEDEADEWNYGHDCEPEERGER